MTKMRNSQVEFAISQEDQEKLWDMSLDLVGLSKK